jgi:hypothetical protein
MDTRFVALEAEASQRAKRHIADVREGQAKTFIAVARERPYYPYRNPSNNLVEEYSRNLYQLASGSLVRYGACSGSCPGNPS